MTRVKQAFAAVAVILAATPALAEGRLWRVDPAQSSLGFRYEVDGKETEGLFATFTGEARFDPAALAEADLTLDVETGSIDLGEPVGTSFVKSVDWLFVEEHPTARFILTGLTGTGDGQFRAVGDLTMRGVTKEVMGDLTVTLGETMAIATGEARFDRKEFGIGVGFSTLFVEIGPEVAVSFNLTATPVK